MPEGFATLPRRQTRRWRGASGAGSGPPIGVGMFIPFPPRPIQVTKHASSPPTALRQTARSASIGPRAADGGQERRRELLELGRADAVVENPRPITALKEAAASLPAPYTTYSSRIASSRRPVRCSLRHGSKSLMPRRATRISFPLNGLDAVARCAGALHRAGRHSVERTTIEPGCCHVPNEEDRRWGGSVRRRPSPALIHANSTGRRADPRGTRALLPGEVYQVNPSVSLLSPWSGSEAGDASDEAVSPAPATPGSDPASDQRRPFDSYLPCLRPVCSSFRIDGSLIERSVSVAARSSISCTVESGWSRKACSTNRRTEPLGARLPPLARRFPGSAFFARLPRETFALARRPPPAARTSSSSFLASARPRA